MPYFMDSGILKIYKEKVLEYKFGSMDRNILDIGKMIKLIFMVD